ncbi:hypothetical protein TNCV_5115761 [Trichonephila clavipes]|nr:hypothetical protein TNCV_5115761 [Trichonephila clavipes]
METGSEKALYWLPWSWKDFNEMNKKACLVAAPREFKKVIKGLPNFTTTKEIRSALEELGYLVESCSQMISKKNKAHLPFFQVNLSRNDHIKSIFDLLKLG